MSESISFEGRVAIVTGAGNGLGRSHARLLAARGAKVVVNDLGGDLHGGGQGNSAADAVVDEIKAEGGIAVANYDSVEHGERVVECALDNYGRIDMVINNAGILRDSSFKKMTDQDWDLVYRVHLLGAYKVTRAAWPHLLEQQYGRVIFTSSASGIYGNFGQANYSSAKLGLQGMSQTLAIEGKSKNVLCNAIAPVAGSRMSEAIFPKEVIQAMKPESISPLVAYLCHERSDVTGGLFEVGLGWVSRLRWERSKGVNFDLGSDHTPEDIADQWKAICDFSDADHPTLINESINAALKNLPDEILKKLQN